MASKRIAARETHAKWSFDPAAFGKNVNDIRENAGIALGDFAKETGLSCIFLENLERGIMPLVVTASSITKMANALGETPDALFNAGLLYGGIGA